MPKIPQNRSQTLIKHYNQFRSVQNEALIWLKISTDTGNKLKVETEVNEGYKQLIDLIPIEIIKVEQQKSPEHDIITLPMTPIINRYFNKHPMLWELICCCLLHTSEIVMKSICHQKNLNIYPKHFPDKINQVPCTICYT